MDENLKDRDILPVKEKNGNELKAVTGQNADGTPKTVLPTQENNPDFLRIDRHGNMLENFFANFIRQMKDPMHFLFCKVPTNNAELTAKNLQSALENPQMSAQKEFLDMHRVDPEAFAKKQSYAVDENRIDWNRFDG